VFVQRSSKDASARTSVCLRHDLAHELGISRLPVLNAFEQLLHGDTCGRVGSGTYVPASILEEIVRPVPKPRVIDRRH
jgi:GntR family transcriptional regulator/MocR family aminotransferase